jgi:16S rRNA (adenine1518-N6/adenine1519-N6)-dimethyltransferase
LPDTASRGSKKKPKLGQHFLADRTVAQQIVGALGDISQETVLEIGAGRGVLTDKLVIRAKKLMAIELDRVLAAQLRLRYVGRTNVEIIEADILTVELPTLLHITAPGPLKDLRPLDVERVRVVGNLPYYITSDILLRLFEQHRFIDSIVIMVQKEVADRIAASPGTRDYGLLSATAQLYTDVEKLFVVPPSAFAPPPKVHSAVLRMTVAPKFESLKVDDREFIDLLKLSFGQKRKTLANNLKGAYDPKLIAASMKKANLKPDVRSEAVPLAKMANLWNLLRNLGV